MAFEQVLFAKKKSSIEFAKIEPMDRFIPLDGSMLSSYEWNYGIIGTPVAGPPGTPMEISQIHAPICFHVFYWAMQSGADKMKYPAAPPQSTNEVLVGKKISPHTPGITPSGEQIWTVFGEYRYLMRVPPSVRDELAAGTNVADPSTALENTVTRYDFDPELTGPPPPVTKMNRTEYLVETTAEVERNKKSVAS